MDKQAADTHPSRSHRDQSLPLEDEESKEEEREEERK